MADLENLAIGSFDRRDPLRLRPDDASRFRVLRVKADTADGSR
jgi:hypothetical protein